MRVWHLVQVCQRNQPITNMKGHQLEPKRSAELTKKTVNSEEPHRGLGTRQIFIRNGTCLLGFKILRSGSDVWYLDCEY